MSLLGSLTAIALTAIVSVAIGYRLGNRERLLVERRVHVLNRELTRMISRRKTWSSGDLKMQVKILISRILT